MSTVIIEFIICFNNLTIKYVIPFTSVNWHYVSKCICTTWWMRNVARPVKYRTCPCLEGKCILIFTENAGGESWSYGPCGFRGTTTSQHMSAFPGQQWGYENWKLSVVSYYFVIRLLTITNYQLRWPRNNYNNVLAN